MLPLLRSSVLVACAMLALASISQPAWAGFVSDYQASSNLFPDQISPPYTRNNTANPENPELSGGILTLSTDVDRELMDYIQLAPIVDTSGPFFVEARLRLLSGSSLIPSRAPVMIGFTTAPAVGNILFIDQNQVFFNVPTDAKGPTFTFTPDALFHTYRIEYDGANGIDLFRDDVLVIENASTFTNVGVHGNQERIFWGDGTIGEFGTSEWLFVRHNALAIPEPAALALIGLALAGLGFSRRPRA